MNLSRHWIVLLLPLMLIGCNLDEKSDMDKARDEKKARWDATRAAIHLQVATQQYESGDVEKSRETLQKVFAVSPDFVPAHILAARQDIESGDMSNAQKHLELAIKTDPELADSYYYLGMVHQRRSENELALEAYKTAWDKRPTGASFILAYAEMLIAMDRLEQAEKVLTDNLQKFEQSSAVRAALGRLYALRNNFEQASRMYMEASLRAPEDKSIKFTYAENLLLAGQPTRAIPALEELATDAKFDQHQSVLLTLGKAYRDAKRMTDSRKTLTELTKLAPSNAQAWLQLARTEIVSGNDHDAEWALSRVFQIDPNNFEGLIMQGVTLRHQSKFDAADKALDKAEQINPNHPTVLALQALNAKDRKAKSEATGYVERYLKVRPDDAWGLKIQADINAMP